MHQTTTHATTFFPATILLGSLVLGACASDTHHTPKHTGAHAMTSNTPHASQPSSLGAFSVSLTVKDIATSKAFYEKLGFTEAGGDAAQHWLILRNGTTTIGLFQGMFDANILTFNPGWSADAQPVASFEDVRSIQSRLKAGGIVPVMEADASTTGPASCVLVDPDGNQILIDQHVPSPGR